MAGFSGFGEKWGKKIKKIDPLRGGDVILEKAGIPTMTGKGEKNIMGATPEAAPAAEKAAVMPVADDEKATSARRRRLAQQQQQQGRSSTILTDADRLGG